MNIIFIETFYGGSHKSFLDGLVKYSRHDLTPITLPSRFWKWRIRSSALYVAETYREALRSCDLIMASDLINLAEVKALSGFTCPAILFMHENQLTYPTPEGEKPEIQFGLINLASCLVADRCLFNSHYQYDEFDYALRQMINDIPEFVPEHAHSQVMAKSQVIYMGIDVSEFPASEIVRNPAPVILWNHRWEFDKQPAVFFREMYKLAEEGIDYRLIILGENFQMHPREFIEARDRLGNRILQYGFVDSLEDYARFLAKSDIIISTAIQENFGFAVTEGMYCHNLPLLPNRLSYPEILPKKFHAEFLYDSEEEMDRKLHHLVKEYRQMDEVRNELAQAMSKFNWNNRIVEFDQVFEKVVAERR